MLKRLKLRLKRFFISANFYTRMKYANFVLRKIKGFLIIYF